MDEEADLALLDQHLLKTNLLSQRMTNILGQLDTRLSRLDKQIAPLGLQPLTRKAANIDSALLSLSSKSLPATSSGASHSRQPSHPPRPPRGAIPQRLSSNASASSSPSSSSGLNPNKATKGYSLEPIAGSPTGTPSHSRPVSALGMGGGTATPADETAILTRGPDVMALGEYFAALDAVVADLERMWRGLVEGRGGAREAGVRDLTKLVEIGLNGLVKLFLQISKDGTSRYPDPDQLLANGAPTPPNLFPPLATVLPLTSHLTALTSPRTPHPKTAELARPAMADLTRGLGEIRAEWMRRTLAPMFARVEEVDEGGIWEGGRGGEKVRALVGVWEAVLVLAEAETLLITTLFPSQVPPDLLAATLSGPISAVSATLTPTINTIKRSLSTHAFVAIDLFQSFSRLQPRWEPTLSKCFSMVGAAPSASSSPATREMLTILNGPLGTFRQLSMRSFPEFLVDIRTAQSPPGPASGISDTTYSTLTYLETLPKYEKTVEALLGSSQSQRSWLMGQKDTPSQVRSAEEEGGIVNLFVADVLGTLIIHLNQRASPMRKPVGQTFMLNNLSHIRNTTASFSSDIIGPGAEDMLNKAFRDAKAAYLAEWSALNNLLNTSSHSTTSRFVPSVGGGNERQHIKEAATLFFDRLTELEGLCTQYTLSRQDPDLRDRLGREVAELVSGAYGAFAQRAATKGAEKHLRGSTDDVVARVKALFR